MYDVIVVGARCAGSATALQLARKGYKVLLLDKGEFPSDKPLSTHMILHPGVAALSRWGLLDALKATGCPPVTQQYLDFGDGVLVGAPPPMEGADAAYSPRRYALDPVLLEGAVAAGAEFREQVVVRELVFEGDTVVGVKGHDKRTNTEFTERAKVVVGADGANSRVARCVDANEYHVTATRSALYFSYWSGDYPHKGQGVVFIRPRRLLAAAPTNNGLTIVMDYFPVAEWNEFSSDVTASFMSDWQEHAPEFFEFLNAAKQEERWLGTAYQPNRFRRASGPGWALVGDADIHHDSINPTGITYAFINSELLVDAIDEGLTGKSDLLGALNRYEKRREQRWKTHFDFIVAMADIASPVSPVMRGVFAEAVKNPAFASEFFGFFEGYEEHLDFLSPERLRDAGIGADRLRA